MLKKLLKISLALVMVGTGFYFAKDFLVFGKYAYVRSLSNPEEDEKGNIAGAAEYLAVRNANPATGIVDVDAAYAAYAQAEMQSFNKYGIGSNLVWKEMGPDNIGGRCRAIIVDKDSNNVLYAAGVTGGIFKSVDAASSWQKVGNNPVANQAAVSLCEGADGAIYYGTGENAFLPPNPIKNSSPGYFGEGIFKSTDHGQTFTQLTNTSPSKAGTQWMDVSFLAADPTNANRIYAGNDGGLQISNDGGSTWTAAWKANGPCKDIRLTKDGNTIFAIISNGSSTPGSSHHIWRSNDKGLSWKEVGTVAGGGVPAAASGMMLAIAPSNENYIYVSVSDGGTSAFKGIYYSSDQGSTWKTFVAGDGTIFNPFSAGGGGPNQGYYDNSLAVDPNNYNKVYYGGINLYSSEYISGSVQTNNMSDWSSLEGYPNYVHADQHIIIFDRTKPYPNAYFGCDGGIFKSSDVANPTVKTPTFGKTDYGFNTTQFYGFGVGSDYPTHVIAGAQDNGEVAVRASGITQLDGASIAGGDAGYSEISMLNPSFYMEEYINGQISRSFDQGNTWADFVTATGEYLPTVGNNYPFITFFSLWESANDPTSIDTVTYQDPAHSHAAGTTIYIESPNGVSFPYVLKKDLPAKAYLPVIDPTQAKCFIGANNGVWMSKQILNQSISDPLFFRIANLPGFVPMMIRSTPDGNTVFAAGYTGGNAQVYRITGLSGKVYKYKSSALTSFSPDSIGIVTTLIYSTSNQVGLGIAIDPNNIKHILFSTGTYDRTNSHVFECDNAMDSVPVFTNISNNLPSLPVYDVLINSHNSKNYLAATEMGIYSSQNSGSTWAEEDNGMERVPVSMLRQQKFSTKPWDGPYIYASTYGRGMFYTSTLTTGIDQQGGSAISKDLNASIYPNPVHGMVNVNVSLASPSAVVVNIYDIQGKQISTSNYNIQSTGNHTFSIPTGSLKEGTYFVKVSAGVLEHTEKMLVLN